jgi:carbamoyl-phosphate synthase large subunit
MGFWQQNNFRCYRGVDMAYDRNNVPNPNEINISRFFTTVLFFTEAGLNMPPF